MKIQVSVQLLLIPGRARQLWQALRHFDGLP
jgi:hypothetical protein